MMLFQNEKKFHALLKLCSSKVNPSFPLHSRAHRMQKFPFYVKRDDELGFGVSGSKLRKYASVLPFIEKEKKQVALVGSPYSNHILSLVQLLKQADIPFVTFLEKSRDEKPKGNFFLLSLLLLKKDIFWVEKIPTLLTQEWISSWEKKINQEFLWIPMGACMEEGLSGALTLPLDIVKNELELGVVFDHVFVDSGTGMSAIALILAFAFLQKKIKIHVTMIAGNKETFLSNLHTFHLFLQKELKEEFSIDEEKYELLFPPTAKSFGSSNKTVFEEIVKTAREEGFFLDPVYTSKLLLTVQEKSPEGNVLWIHSGGALSLFGFQERLLQYAQDSLG